MAKGNFIQNILASVLGGNDANAVKKRMLKKIAKDLSKTKFHFYKPGSHEIDASMAKFFYEIYKALSPLQLMFANTPPNALKRVVIDQSLSENQRSIIESLTEEDITKMAGSAPLSQVTNTVNENLQKFNAEFTSEKIARTDTLYTKLNLLKNFAQYDFFFLLKKFDSGLKEHNFNIPPKFQTIGSSYVLEDIKNFTAVAWSLPFDADWDDIFKLLKNLKGVEPITLNVWKKILVRLKLLHDQHVLEMMIQLITENPSYREIVKGEELHIMDDYISQTRKSVEEVLEDLRAKQTAGKVGGLLSEIFGDTNIEPLKNYNESGCAAFARKNLGTFLYADPLSYLKYFSLNYLKKDMRALTDILVVRGEWATQQLAKPLSEAFHQLMEISTKILALDEKFAENGEYGMKLKTLMPRIERDREARNIAVMILNDGNNEAAQILLNARQNMVAYDKNLKMALEDFVKVPHSKLIVNWKELDHFAEGKLKQMCIDVYKTLFNFVSLLQNFQITINELN